MTKRKATPVAPVVLQMAQDLAQIEARLESITQGAVAQQGHLEQRMRGLEARLAVRPDPEPAAGDVYNITVGEGGIIHIAARS